jgi:hypothetical protein
MMTKQAEKPLWVSIEEEIQGLDGADLQGDREEPTVHEVAAALDEKGLEVSRTGGRMLQLRWALKARATAGHPLIADLNQALGGLAIDDVADTHAATLGIVRRLTPTWPVLSGAEYIEGIQDMVLATRLALLTAEAKSRSQKEGVRYLRENHVAGELILDGLGIDQATLDAVDAELAAERAELARVRGLFAAVADKEMGERIKHLLDQDAADEVIAQVAGVKQDAIDAARVAIKQELEEKKRLAAEEAERKAAEAAGPALEDIPSDEMLEHIESIREILEFSDEEKEIRVMCEQSSIPRALVDIAVSEPEKLDELEAKAES